MKKLLKKIPGVNSFYRFAKRQILAFDFNRDKQFFLKYYLDSKKTITKIEYDILLVVHRIEKGMSSKELRPFGVEKIKKLMNLIKQYETLTKEESFAYQAALGCLTSYREIYEKHGWNKEEIYSKVNFFLKERGNNKKLSVGSYEISSKDIEKDAHINYMSFLKSRHSVRSFSDQPLEREEIEKAIQMAIQTPSACNRQMCKIYYVKSKDNVSYLKKYAQGLGLFDLTNANYFIVTFDVSANYFMGERNQGWLNAGLMAMNFVNGLHSLGIGSCFIQSGNSFKEEKECKKQLGIQESERIAVIVVAGHYDEVTKVTYSTRKKEKDIYFER